MQVVLRSPAPLRSASSVLPGLQTIMRGCGARFELPCRCGSCSPCSRLTALNVGCMMGISNVGVSIMADHAKQVFAGGYLPAPFSASDSPRSCCICISAAVVLSLISTWLTYARCAPQLLRVRAPSAPPGTIAASNARPARLPPSRQQGRASLRRCV